METKPVNGPDWLLLGRTYTCQEEIILRPMTGFGREWFTQESLHLANWRLPRGRWVPSGSVFTVVGEKVAGFCFSIEGIEPCKVAYYSEYTILLLNGKTYLLEKSPVPVYRNSLLEYATIVDI